MKKRIIILLLMVIFLLILFILKNVVAQCVTSSKCNCNNVCEDISGKENCLNCYDCENNCISLGGECDQTYKVCKRPAVFAEVKEDIALGGGTPIRLPFFDGFNFIFTVILLIIIYCVRNFFKFSSVVWKVNSKY